jgi:hypothetical protein
MHAALWFGALPCLLSGLLVFAAKHVDPAVVPDHFVQGERV